jgi:hypothetical protein
MEITIDPDAMEEDEFSQNLAEELSDKYMEELASDLLDDYSNDVNSRKDWLETYVDGLELLGLKNRTKKRTMGRRMCCLPPTTLRSTR